MGERSAPVWTDLLITQPERRAPIVVPAIDGNRCAEAMLLDSRSVTRKYNATEENICTGSSVMTR